MPSPTPPPMPPWPPIVRQSRCQCLVAVASTAAAVPQVPLSFLHANASCFLWLVVMLSIDAPPLSSQCVYTSQCKVPSLLPGWLLRGLSLHCNLLTHHRLLTRCLVVVLPLVVPPFCLPWLVVTSPLIALHHLLTCPLPPLDAPLPHPALAPQPPICLLLRIPQPGLLDAGSQQMS
jgi:hypothetical protein